jgi:hypothetical protein
MGALPIWWDLFNYPPEKWISQIMGREKDQRHEKIRRRGYLEQARIQTQELIDRVSRHAPAGRTTERMELLAALELLLLHCDRFQILRDRAAGEKPPAEMIRHYREQVDKTSQLFREAWMRRNREADLPMIIHALAESAP